MKQTIFILLLCIGILGSTSVSFADEEDYNGDGKPDIWSYSRAGYIYKTAIDRNFDEEPDLWYFWSTDGKLLRKEKRFKDLEGNEKLMKYYYKDHTKIDFRDEKVWKNVLDLDKSYPELVRPRALPTHAYTNDHRILFEDIDTDRDGQMDKTTFYKDFRPIDLE